MRRNSRHERLANSDYPELREVLAPQYRNLPAEDIEALFESYNLSAEDIEGFFDTLKDIGKAVVSAAPTILPVAGTVVGTAFGGPAGAALGGALGNLAGGAISQATGPRPAAAPRPAPAPQIPQPPPGASPAAGQMLQTMFRPEMLQALIQMLLGQLAGSNITVGNRSVPVEAFTNLMGTMANQAQAEYHAANISTRAGMPEYLLDYAGEAVGDPAVAEHRAQALYELLQETDVEQAIPRRISRPRAKVYAEAYDEGEGYDEAAFYNDLELAELYSEADEW